ncbi:ABC transporter substrate-binding protein [Azospirillum griseum]|uniref:ABC transporter substrate-binding protein n=1 Tax=Azospirillum griseum TaxID=2496639 RepID=A0A431VNG4_9PROT|nr:ABC transporter substrate-binding protein [Azospirillum griseum]RTR24311.1 ABC transporter substrate-binding protein [Azospirillum griseum]
MSRKFALLVATALTAVSLTITVPGLTAGTAQAQSVPAGYDPSYAKIIEAANQEGALSIYSATDASAVSELLKGFEALYPKIKLEYADQNSTEMYNRFISEAAANTGTADLMWSSAMDLQIKLVNDGYAQPYATQESKALPAWANWKNEAYGTTAEPIVFAYNKRLVPEADVPKTHADLAKLLTAKADAYKGKVTSYDPERSGVGFLYITQDAQANSNTWDLVKAMGQTGVKLYTSSGAMIERLTSGEHTIGYNMIGSYVLERQKKDPTSIGVVLPNDYTIVMSRIAFIPKAARHPNAAKLFLDYLLSKQGQEAMVARYMGSIRTDLTHINPTADLPESMLRPIQVGPELLTYLDQAKRLKFLKDWQKSLQGK